MSIKPVIDLDILCDSSIQEDNKRLRTRIIYLEEENNRLQLEIEAYQVMSHGHRRHRWEDE